MHVHKTLWGAWGKRHASYALKKWRLKGKWSMGLSPGYFFFGYKVHASSSAAQCRKTHNNTQPWLCVMHSVIDDVLVVAQTKFRDWAPRATQNGLCGRLQPP